MSVASGTRLGSYEIVAPLGAGGMAYYRNGDRMMVVAIEARSGLAANVPRELFTTRCLLRDYPFGPRNYDVAADGRFVMVARRNNVQPQTIHVVLDWPEIARKPK